MMVVMVINFVFKGFPVRYTSFTYLFLTLAWLALVIFFCIKKQMDIITLITNEVILVICILLLGFMQFNSEMTKRKQYNRDRIVDVEI